MWVYELLLYLFIILFIMILLIFIINLLLKSNKFNDFLDKLLNENTKL